MQAALVRKRIHNPAEQHSDTNKKDERLDAVINPLPRCVSAQNGKHDRDEKSKKRHGWKMMDDHFKTRGAWRAARKNTVAMLAPPSSLTHHCLSRFTIQCDVVCVKDREHVQHPGGNQISGSVIRAHEKRITASISKKFRYRHRQARAQLP